MNSLRQITLKIEQKAASLSSWIASERKNITHHLQLIVATKTKLLVSTNTFFNELKLQIAFEMHSVNFEEKFYYNHA